MSVPVLDISIVKGTKDSLEAACEIHEDGGKAEDGNCKQLTGPGEQKSGARRKVALPKVTVCIAV